MTKKKKKKRGSQIFYAGVKPPETDMFLPPIPGGSKGTTRVWKLVGSRTRRGKDSLLKTRYGYEKTVPILEWAPKSGLTPDARL